MRFIPPHVFLPNITQLKKPYRYAPKHHLPRMWQPQHHPARRRRTGMLRLRIFLDRPLPATLTAPSTITLSHNHKKPSHTTTKFQSHPTKSVPVRTAIVQRPLYGHYKAPVRTLQGLCTDTTRPLYGPYKALVVFREACA